MQINHGVHLVNIIGRQECKKHNAPLGLPCFTIRKGKGNGYFPAICNKRAVKAGANGKISEASLPTRKKSFTRKAA